MKNINNHKAGFTLVELSIVLLIIGLVLFSTISLGMIQIEKARIEQTRNKMDKIDRALLLYLSVNGTLPCPASGTIARDTSTTNSTHFGQGESVNASTGVSDTTCPYANSLINDGGKKAYTGVIPTRDLDLPDEFMLDAWNNRFTYAVSKNCVDSDNWSLPLTNITDTKFKTDDPATKSPYGCVMTKVASHVPGGEITILDNYGHRHATSETAYNYALPPAVYVVISHGKNGLGAWHGVATRYNNSTTSSTYELDNANLSSASGGADAYNLQYRDDMLLDSSDAGSSYFDDIVHWKTGTQMKFDLNY